MIVYSLLDAGMRVVICCGFCCVCLCFCVAWWFCCVFDDCVPLFGFCCYGGFGFAIPLRRVFWLGFGARFVDLDSLVFGRLVCFGGLGYFGCWFGVGLGFGVYFGCFGLG